MDTFGERLKLARRISGLSQKELATKIGVSSASIISNWETNTNAPSIDALARLCIVLQAGGDYMLGLEHPMGEIPEGFLEADELMLLNNYRSMTNKKQELVKQLIQALK